MNLARIYNLNFKEPEVRIVWPFELALTGDYVWEAFFIYSLLLDHMEHGTILDLPHAVPDQTIRLRAALEARTLAMAGPGQELWSHACDLCCKYRTTDSGVIGKLPRVHTYLANIIFSTEALRATVTDGVSMGHLCCGVHDCKQPLTSQRRRFCTQHDNLKDVCAVTTCSRPCDPGYKTCGVQEHRRLEVVGNEQRTAMFQLRKRLERLNSTQIEDALSSGLGALNLEVDENVDAIKTAECNDKPPEGNTKPRIRLNRRRTHNEQLCVTTCGVILGRATFFGSEAVNGVVVSTFPTHVSSYA